MRGILACVVGPLAGAMLLWPTAAAAQAPDLASLVGRPVAGLRITIEGQPADAPELRDLLQVNTGAPLDLAAVRESLTHLFNTRRFEDVVVTAEQNADGILLEFALTPDHPVDRLEFRGTLGLDRRALERAALEQSGGRAVDVRPEAAIAAVSRLLVDEGFVAPVITAATEQTHVVHRSTLVLTVNAGPRLRVGDVRVVGAMPLERSAVTSSAGLAQGEPYRRRATEDALRDVADRLRSLRYYEASVSHFATPAGDNVVDVTVTVDTGPQVAIVVEGDPLPPGGLDEWIPVRRENSADDDLLEDSAFRIERAWQREGYWTADVQWRRSESGDGRMELTFTIARGRQYRIASVTATGQDHFSESDIRLLLRLEPGTPFVEETVELRIAELLRAYAFSGFDATVDYRAEALPGEDGDVAVSLTIDEGPLRVVNDVRIVGADQIPEADVRRVVRSQEGEPLRDAQVREDRSAIQQLYLDRGFLTVLVSARLTPEAPFQITYEIDEGRQTIVDHVIVVGNERVDTDTILAEVTLVPGAPYGQAARFESQRRLAELATFRRITISEAGGSRTDGHVDVIVQVEEAPATTIGYGGGLEFGTRPRAVEGGGTEDALLFAPRGFFEIGRRNLFGTNRSATLFTRASLGSRSVPDDPARDRRGLTLSEYRVTGSYRSPRAFAGRLDTVLSATVERTIRTSFTFGRRSINAEGLHRRSADLSTYVRYALDSTELYENRIPEDEQPLIDRLFPQIRLSTVSAGIVWDRRDDLLDPTAGGLMSLDGEVGARAIGSDVGFAKIFGQAYGFRRITRRNRVVLGGRVQVGLARGFARELPLRDSDGEIVPGPDGQPIIQTVEDVPAGRRFFAGGGSSVRGFQQDRLGVPGVLNEDGLSNGGNGLIILNFEVRTQLFADIAVVGFVDGGNVFARAGDLSLSRMRGTAGVGLRYRSPLGPLRLDVGFKFDRRLIGGRRERGWEFHLSIGEIF
jgi:outer membrane protein assembly complex protein YaeT